MGKGWTKEEDAILEEWYSRNGKWDEILSILDKSKATITKRTTKLGLPKKYPNHDWHDITGQRFGRLTAIRKAEPARSSNGAFRTMWLCKCDCGNEIVVDRKNLVSGTTKSCGCWRRERMTKMHVKENKYNLTDYDYGVGMDESGRFFFFDKADFNVVKTKYWCVEPKKKYVFGNAGKINKKGTHTISLHRYLSGLEHNDPAIVDHSHGNPNDCRRDNLRITTQMINTWNYTRIKTTNTTSGELGVTWCKHHQAWKAYITTNKKRIVIGYYPTIKQAVHARVKAEEEQRGMKNYFYDVDDNYFNPNTIDYDPSTFKTVEEVEKDYEKLINEDNIAV